MKKRKVIHVKNFPSKPPLMLTAVTYLFMDKFNAPAVVWGVIGTLFAGLWLIYCIAKHYEDQVDISEIIKGEEETISLKEKAARL